MFYPRPPSPRTAWRDLRAFFASRQPHQLLFATLAVAMTVLIIIGFIIDGNTNLMPGPQIIYVESWPANRTDAQIIAQQKVDSAAMHEAKAERQREFQQLARRLGIE